MEKIIQKSSLFVILLTVAAVSVRAATCPVPSAGYPTIQSAVDDATCTTVNVAPGLYAENVVIPRALILNGAKAGQSVGSRTSAGPDESTVVGVSPAGDHAAFTVNAASVTIDGFTIKNSVTTGAAIGIQVKPGSNDAVILNNFVDGIQTTDPAGTAQGVYLQNGLININTGNNDIRNVSSPGTATGVRIGDNNAIDGSDVIYTHDNNISAVTSAADGACAVMGVKLSSTPGAFFIRGNHISSLTGAAFVHAISLEADVLDEEIIENDFTGLASATGEVVAIWFNNVPKVYSGDCSVNYFFLPETAYGIKIVGATDPTVPPPLSARCIWWGSADGPGPVGPGHGCRVSPGVEYVPWRVNTGSDNSSCVGSNVPADKADCKNGGWITHVRPDGTAFKNQGDCIQFVNTGK